MRPPVPPFRRVFFGAAEPFTRIGDGDLGGKATGLWLLRELIATHVPPDRFSEIVVDVPVLAVVTTDVFDRFVSVNGLARLASGDEPDDRIAHAFQQGDFPPDLLGDVRALVEQVRSPLAVRSSSLLEDALAQPFAGVYATKMTPNNQPAPDDRFRRLIEAIKLVFASTFFHDARAYRAAVGRADDSEKMAVVVQEVVGRRHGERYYPEISGVARSWNFYRTGKARPEDGVVSLALGLGKTIVDGGRAWSYSPAYPRVAPPARSIRDRLAQTQSDFWAVNMGRPPAFDPVRETEYLVKASLADAELDNTLRMVASTYDPHGDRLTPGTSRAGARVVTFAPLLELEALPVNAVIRTVLRACEETLGGPVEIEFAMTFFPGSQPAGRFGLLQVRPMSAPAESIDLSEADLDDPRAVVSSPSVMGNGRLESIRDIVFVPPDLFERRDTRLIGAEIARVNADLVAARRPYLLIGFGRWGSTDPWLGVPVRWNDIGGARAIVEASLEDFPIDPSQGSHFFHNLSAFEVGYFTVGPGERGRIDWAWLLALPAEGTGRFIRHVTLAGPLAIAVDGRAGRGVILKP
jgi:hypothetical protein